MNPIVKRLFVPGLVGMSAALLLWAAPVQPIDKNALIKTADSARRPAASESNEPVERQAKLTTSYSSVVKQVASSVVSVYTTKTIKSAPGSGPGRFFDDPMFRRFFGEPFGDQPSRRAPRPRQEQGLGSGVIVSEDGYILTNNHVVDGADEVKVALSNQKREFVAKVVGRDPKTDIAVLKVQADGLPYLSLADSEKIEVGDVVLAVGNPFGLGQTVTMGIVSAVGRNNVGIEDYEDFIQTDAAINPGNSGGALVNVDGQMIGLNTAILSRSGGNQGIGFAVPSNLARNIMERLMKDGKIVRGYLGVIIQEVTPELAKEFKVGDGKGALISEVTTDSAAAEAGLKPGDVIIEFDGKPIKDSHQLRLLASQSAPNSRVSLKVLRQGKEKTFDVKLKAMPDQKPDGSSLEPDQSSGEALSGVAVDDLTPTLRSQWRIPSGLPGAVVTEVEPESAAAHAGLQPGDVILEINRQPVKNAEQAVNLCKDLKEQRILLRVWSRGGTRFVVVDESKTR